MMTIKKYNLFSLIIVLLILAACSSGGVSPDPNTPEGDFWADPPIFQACLSGRVGFNLTNNADLSGAEYEYDFGDDTGILRVTGNNVFHLYREKGTYSVSVKIYKDNVEILKKFQQIVVKDDLNCASSTNDEESYIVVLKNNVASIDSVLGEVTSNIGGEQVQNYQNALRGFAVSLSSQEATQLGRLDEVDFVELDRIIKLDATQSPVPSWGLGRVDQRNGPEDNSYSYDSAGKGVHAYIIDSGIHSSHQDFAGRVTGGTTFVTDGLGTGDCNGHGTHVAGTLGGSTYGIAKQVSLHPVRIFSCEGLTRVSTVIKAVDWVTQNHQKPAVVNMSLGGEVSDSLDAAIRNSLKAGITYVLAAGNEYGADSCTRSPARVGEAITVGSSTLLDKASDFSNQGPCVDLFAPGSDITSAWIDSNTASLPSSGTSMATPHVAGAVAIYLAKNPNATPAQVQNTLLNLTSKNKLSGVNSDTANSLLYIEPSDGNSNAVKVELDRNNITLQPGQRIEITAKVIGTNNDDVIWEAGEGNGGVNGAGNKVLYTAPERAGTFFLRAVSIADPTASDTAVIKVVTKVSVTLTPASIELKPNEQVTFTALVEGSQNTDVIWEVSDGRIEGTGNTITYTAPANPGVQIIAATSKADPTAKALAKIIVSDEIDDCNQGTRISISPERVELEKDEKIAFIATVACTNNTAVNWEVTPINSNITASQIQTRANSQHIFIFGLCGVPDDWTLTAISAANPNKRATATIRCKDELGDIDLQKSLVINE